jgi:hypothetical protein
MSSLKVVKCEIFDGSDFHDFDTRKPFWVGDLGIKYKLVTLIFRGARHHLTSDAYAQRTHQSLSKLSACISS